MNSGVNGQLRQADIAYSGLRDLIVTLELHPGAALAEDELMRRLEVGRTPLREAVKRLEVESLVVVYPRRGTFVSEVHLADHSLICDVRRQLESHAARRAAERATAADRSRLEGLEATIAAHAGGRAASMRLDTEIHREVYRCAHNHYLEHDLSHYYNLSLRIWYLFLDRLPEVDHDAEHLPMIRAIREGDGEAAAGHAHRHVTHFEESVRSAL
ncbi:GntR family transcriptional regulator [Kineosporia sp. J2-2]|uniref:GntR family transcriptional regulator n=1 Tax=Kineosporia corallincola TaxID=2835133 RepID=A0ABS5T8J3_9ACTN|nr:GntR family transcriptional regulator [Kineosporia corallincola]MBT0767382.1 GntR family transcriptional regulator [Kineosporia corallincola]